LVEAWRGLIFPRPSIYNTHFINIRFSVAASNFNTALAIVHLEAFPHSLQDTDGKRFSSGAANGGTSLRQPLGPGKLVPNPTYTRYDFGDGAIRRSHHDLRYQRVQEVYPTQYKYEVARVDFLSTWSISFFWTEDPFAPDITITLL